MVRAPCCEKVGLKRGRWTAEEDEILRKYIEANGEGSWRSLPKNAGLLRCGKSCRLRWINYLRSDLKRGNISAAEDELIINLRASLGSRWSLIAAYLPGRTDNEIKNYWNSHLSRKIQSRRPNPNFIPPSVPPPLSSVKSRRRNSRSAAMKNTKNSDRENIAPKIPEQANGTVPMPTTPNPEKEAVPRHGNTGGDVFPESLEISEEMENGILCLEDFMEDLDGILSLDHDEKDNGMVNTGDEREVDPWGEKPGSGNSGEWSSLMVSSPGKSWEDENKFSWFWDGDFTDVVNNLEWGDDRHNEMVSWLMS